MSEKRALSDVICNTSPLQYLHQLGLLDLFPGLVGHLIVPPAVLAELTAGRAAGMNLPDLAALDWITMRQPISGAALPLVTDLGAGETEVLMLGLELSDVIVVLDDALARRVAESLDLRPV